ncbi:hypothetical protein CDD80_2314 [Ophiocordyceps camponoti-rufipedis]|uniref:Something about silencing protein 4 domain-containing protein n=1 Tax=Ophiocordyceps camponoti-rufipedis TaxID=2004952 RepID=A0A2C5Z3B4_9HYPO|nr:hypothetical protein CDD80_2314 [Ophiocordyceps camponoti-rufipedis]
MAADVLNLDTPIVVFDSVARDDEAQPPEPEYPVRSYDDALFTDILDAQRIDFGFLEAQDSNAVEDPLPDSLYEPIHRKAKRLERSIRNTEKGRAQHEKDQIIRLLDGLQGHDWLRVMGVSGITETKKKAFEPAREHFIRGCQAILDKFHNWSQAEKRRKQKRQRATTGGDDKRRKTVGHGQGRGRVRDLQATARRDREDSSAAVADDSDDASEESLAAAQQLRQEAMARTSRTASTGAAPGPARAPSPAASSSASSSSSSSSNSPPPAAPPSPRPFTSFFRKSYEREAAVNRHRRKGRKLLAWGHPIPDMAEGDFMLPEEFRDEDTLKARARKKRRDKRSRRSD